MNINVKRSLALLLALVLCIGLLPATQIVADAATVDYVYSGEYIYNWGTRGETATFLSPNAEEFYSNTTYETLSAYPGGTGVSDAPSSALYTALQTLMKDAHSYETSYEATKNLYQYTDCQNSGKDTKEMSSFYSGDPIGPTWDSGKTWNREHTWPNSKGLAGNDENDIMMLRPTASSENGARGNKAYGTSDGFYYPNKESNDVYDVRGDVARIFLYIYVRWGNVNGNSQYGTVWGSDGVIESLDVLLDWMEADPVDTWELGRNDSVEAITGTRNVFVDYPEFAFLLFGEEIPTDMTTPSGEAKNSDPCQHNYVAGTPVAPTCTEEGYTTYTCTLCSKSYNGDKVAATGHNYVEGACQNCGKTQPSGDTVLLYYPQDQKYITGTEYLYTSATSGNQKYELELTTDKTNALQLNRIDNDDGTVTFATADGKYLMADGTNVRLADAEGEHTKFVLEGAANGHYIKCANATYGGNAQYLEVYNGYLTVYSFDTSNTALYTFQLENLDGEVEVCQHSYSSVVTAPTCTEDGYTTYTCTLCGYNYTGDPVAAIGHSYENGACTVCGEAEPDGSITSATITFDDTAKRTEFSTSKQVWTENGITVTNEKGSSTSNVADYSNPARFYKSSTLTIAYPGMTKIEVACNTAAYATALQSSVTSGTVTVDGKVVTIVLSEAADTYSVALSGGQVRVDSITVYAEDTGSGDTDCQHTNTQVLPAVPATCTEPGLTEGKKCADCGEVLTAQVEIPATGHNYVGGTCATCGAAAPTTGETSTVTVIIADYAAANGWVNEGQYPTVLADDVITITASAGQYTGKYYSSNTTWRIYQADNATLTVTAADGATIISVKITYSISNNGILTFGSEQISSGTTVDVNATSAVFGVGNTGTKTNGQVRITKIEVVYTAGTEPTAPDLPTSNQDFPVVTNPAFYVYCEEGHSNEGSLAPCFAADYCVCTEAVLNAEGLWESQLTFRVRAFIEEVVVVDIWPGHVIAGEPPVEATFTIVWNAEEQLWQFAADHIAIFYAVKAAPAVCEHTNTQVLPAVPATCTEPGLTEGKKCADCGEVLTAQVEVSATGHDYDTVVTAPNCTEGGYTTYTCSVCGDSYTGDETPATGHDYDNVVTAPNCTEGGYTTYTCSTCGDSKVEDLVPALGHNHQPQVVPPTCTEPGYTRHKCSRCEDSYITNPVEALGHTEVSDPAVAPTCVDTGLTAGIHCDVCGEVLVAQTEVPATGEHTYEDGNCTVCGQAAPDCDHGSTEVLPGVTPSCTASGWTEGSKCAICGEILIPQEEIPATGHNFVGSCTVDIIPTEKTEGHLTGTCVVCAAPVEVTLPALNMAAYAFTVVTAPADGNPGTGRFTWNETAYGEFSFEVEFRYGDVNGDGMIDGRDVIQLRKFMANYDYDAHTSTEFAFAGADVNGDGQVNGQDVILLRRYMANYDYDTGESSVILGPSTETP